jgi:hypothetical protein
MINNTNIEIDKYKHHKFLEIIDQEKIIFRIFEKNELKINILKIEGIQIFD